jgi:hypothetical protein
MWYCRTIEQLWFTDIRVFFILNILFRHQFCGSAYNTPVIQLPAAYTPSCLEYWNKKFWYYSFLGVLHALAWAKNTLWDRPCLSVCRVLSTGVGNLHDRESLLCNNGNPRLPLVKHYCATVTSDHIGATVIYAIRREKRFWNVGLILVATSLLNTCCP